MKTTTTGNAQVAEMLKIAEPPKLPWLENKSLVLRLKRCEVEQMMILRKIPLSTRREKGRDFLQLLKVLEKVVIMMITTATK